MTSVIVSRLFPIILILMVLHGIATAKDGHSSKIVAIVGDEKITQQDVEQATEKLPEPFRKSFENKALQQLIDINVFYHAAIEEGIEKTPEFMGRMEKEKKRLLASFFIENRIDKQISVSPSEIETYYENNKLQYIKKERVKVARLMIKTKKAADDIKFRLDSGDSFETINQQFSSHLLSNEKPENWIVRGTLPETIETEIFSLKTGQISDAVKTDEGYYLIARLIDKKRGGVSPLSEVKTSIEKQLIAEKKSSLIRKYRKKMGVEIIEHNPDQNPNLLDNKK